MNDTDVQATNTDCKPKLHKIYKLVLQIWLINNNVVPGSTKMLTQEHVVLGKIRFWLVCLRSCEWGWWGPCSRSQGRTRYTEHHWTVLAWPVWSVGPCVLASRSGCCRHHRFSWAQGPVVCLPILSVLWGNLGGLIRFNRSFQIV